ncbi:ABC transporter ATP-binding protein [Thaumasiovibrio subtropicus]|uniref:ABC transporter ATP-binding protein n=1 Tax=Thaumasiovibrio subtropicus TaxID=1891207 RepID=UPI000B35E2E8|nr:ATP-binding cassette domain-containing protein [Thaumasiovibrio subtropicus]
MTLQTNAPASETAQHASLTVTDLTIHAGKKCLLAPLSLTLLPHQPITILGETGSGKSLLAQAIVGILPTSLQQQGDIQLFGQSQAEMSRNELEQLWGRKIAMLPQEPWLALNPVKAARQQIAEVDQLLFKAPASAARDDANTKLSQFGLEHDGDKYPSELSGGMAQRVAYLCATQAGAEVLIADEPTKGLDASRRDQVISLLQRHRKKGALLTITHDIEVAKALGGEVIVMKRGQIMERQPAAQLFASPQSRYAKALITATPAYLQRPNPENTLKSARPLLIAENIGMARGGKTLFRQLSFSLHQGGILGLSGDSGSGKSTLADILLKQLPPQEGVLGQDLKRGEALKLYQDPPSAFAHQVTLQQLLDDIQQLKPFEHCRQSALMTRLNLSKELLARTPVNVSGGELQRFAILRALLMGPKLLVADEPTSRLDPITAMETLQLLVDVATEQACGLILISHDKAALNALCDQVIDLTPQSDQALASEALSLSTN